MRLLALGCVLAGCGRFGFDSGRTGGTPDAPTARPGDAVVDAGFPRCPVVMPAPDPLTLSGQTFEYTGIQNQTAATPNVPVSALSGATVIATTTSDSQGFYTLAISTGTSPVRVTLVYAPPGYLSTTIAPDRLLSTNVVGPNMNYWQLGDGPVWNTGEMNSAYSYSTVARDLAKGTLNVAARDCSDNPLEGVVFTVTPQPDEFSYLNASGAPDSTLASTILPYTHAVGYNAIPGPTHVTATKDGVTIYAIDIDVPAGDATAYPVFYIP